MHKEIRLQTNIPNVQRSVSEVDGASLMCLPDDVLQMVAGGMTAQEWAKSAAGACHRLKRVQLERIELDLSSRTYGDMTRRLARGALRWASKRWAHCTDLDMHLMKVQNEDLADDAATWLRAPGPHKAQRLHLSTSHSPWWGQKAAGYIFHALLASLQPDAHLESLRVEHWIAGSVPNFRNLKHLHLDQLERHVDIACLVVSSTPLPCLETLDLSCAYPEGISLDVKLRALESLQRLTLTQVVPTELQLPSNCKLSLFGREELRGDMAERWWCYLGGERVDNFYMRFQSNMIRDSVLCRLRKFDTLKFFPNIEVLDLDFHDEGKADKALMYEFNPFASVQLKHLTCLRLTVQLEFRSANQMEVTIPACLALKSLIILASRIVLSIESPSAFGASLEEMILASDTPSNAPSHLPVMGGDFPALEERLKRQGVSFHTVIGMEEEQPQRLHPLTGCPLEFEGFHRYGFVVAVKQGAVPRSYEELRDRVCGCLCGVCWCCRFLEGDRESIGFELYPWPE